MQIFGSKYTTANLYFNELLKLHFRLQNSCVNSKELLYVMARRMKTKYDKYWGNIDKINRLLFVTVILGTRYKLIVLKF